MQEITKVSDITYTEAAEYLRLYDLTNDEINLLNTLIATAKAYMIQYTGRTETELDSYQDFVIVLLVLVQDMWDNRTLYVDKSNVNKVVDSILGLHAVNLL